VLKIQADVPTKRFHIWYLTIGLS